MTKKLRITKFSLAKKAAGIALSSWKSVFGAMMRLRKRSQAGVFSDIKGVPHFFIFNTSAMLDILSDIDEGLVDRLSSKEYHSKKINPAGWLIDEIESRLPISPFYIQSLKTAIQEAEKKGWIPFKTVESRHLAK